MQEGVACYKTLLRGMLDLTDNLVDGVVASSGGRHEANVIALYQFKTGSGAIAYDTSGVNPAIDLNIIGNVEWVGGWGINLSEGKAQGSTSASLTKSATSKTNAPRRPG